MRVRGRWRARARATRAGDRPTGFVTTHRPRAATVAATIGRRRRRQRRRQRKSVSSHLRAAFFSGRRPLARARKIESSRLRASRARVNAKKCSPSRTTYLWCRSPSIDDAADSPHFGASHASMQTVGRRTRAQLKKSALAIVGNKLRAFLHLKCCTVHFFCTIFIV